MIIGAMGQPVSVTGAARLPDWGLIRARGVDCASFLHGQLTQDFEHLRNDQARLAGYCSAKGRLLASFVGWQPRSDEIMLACSADLLPATLKRLSMFVLRAKCRLEDASAETALYGLAGSAASAWLGSALSDTLAVPWSVAALAAGQVLRLPDVEGVRRYLLAQPAADPAPAVPALDARWWQWLDVRSGVPRVVAATAEQFVPQMVNFELVGGVNFQKGCYPGQEVVARSQYRGTLKRRALLFDCSADLRPGQEVFHSADPAQPAGQVVNAARLPQGDCTALVEVKRAVLDGGTLHAGTIDGPLLRPASLPYPLPADA